MANNNESHHCGGGKFMSGLLWGAIIGGGLVFLLGTKKGKKIIKTLSEEGIELSQLLGDDEEEEIEEIIVKPKNKTNNQSVKAIQKEEDEDSEREVELQSEDLPESSNGINKKSTISKIVSTPRRFFRGTPKR
ncbi:MAG: hypothetical protein Q7K55_04475 [Candidatus Levybacteria bacterium]|nr:hypothetical protein [Candidatus Levybacteria bacterium]